MPREVLADGRIWGCEDRCASCEHKNYLKSFWSLASVLEHLNSQLKSNLPNSSRDRLGVGGVQCYHFVAQLDHLGPTRLSLLMDPKTTATTGLGFKIRLRGLRYCWWFRNPAITSWGWENIPHYVRPVFCFHPRWCGISEPSTLANSGHRIPLHNPDILHAII